MVQITNLSNTIRIGHGKPAKLSNSGTNEEAGVPQGTESLASQMTTADRLLGVRQDNYLAQSQQANEQLTTQNLIADLNDTLANNPNDFRQAMHAAFGGKASSEAIDALATRILSGDAAMPANIKFVDASVLGQGAHGAYDASNGGTIYLN